MTKAKKTKSHNSSKKRSGARATQPSHSSFASLLQSAWVARKVSHVVKRKGHSEPFDEKKAYASIYFACRSTHMNEQESEVISKLVCQRLKRWILTRRQVDSKEIFHFITGQLHEINPEVAFMYKTHRDIS